MKYMLMFCRTEGAGPTWEEMSPEAQAELGGQIARWHTENTSRLIDKGHRLGPSSAATTVRRKERGVIVLRPWRDRDARGSRYAGVSPRPLPSVPRHPR